MSLPSRERGLKLPIKHLKQLRPVAPFAGAWIEMIEAIKDHGYDNVAPFAGAWIEIDYRLFFENSICVAPFAGAWIEIYASPSEMANGASLPSRERGLK